jgi:hypothetical protein
MAEDSTWVPRANRAEQRIEKALRDAGGDGLTIAQLRAVVKVGEEGFDSGLRRFRESPLCSERRELRQDRAGRWRQMPVLRLRVVDEEGAEPAALSRDAVALAEISANERLRDAIGRAQTKGRKKPNAIARAILRDQMSASFVFQLFEEDLERLLTERVAAELQRGGKPPVSPRGAPLPTPGDS